MSSPVVKLTKLDDSIVKLRMDPKMMKVSGQIMDKLVKYHISSLIGLHMPDFHKDFPDKIPPKLWFPGKGLKKSGEKTIKVKKEASTLEEEAKKFVKEEPSLIPQRKRSTRFSGSYSAEVIHKPASVVRQLKKKVRTTSEASTSSYASSSQTVKPITINCGRGKDAFIRGVDYGSSSSSPGDSSDSEHEAEQKQEQNPNKKVENAQVSYQNVVAPQQTGTRTSNQQEFPSYRPANPSPTVVPSSQILSDSFPAPVRAVNPFRAPRHARQLSDSSSDEEVEVQTKELNLNVQQDSVQELTPAVEQDSVETKKSPGINENVQAKTNGTVFLQDQKLQEPPTAGKSPDVQPAVSEEPEIPEKVVQSFAEKPTDNPKNGEKEKRTSQDSVTVMKVHVNKTSPKPVAEMKKPEKEKKPPANKAAEVQVGKTTQKPEAELKKPEKEKKSPINEAAKIKEKNVRKSANEKDTVKNEAKKSISNKDVKKKSYEKPKFIDPPMVSTQKHY